MEWEEIKRTGDVLKIKDYLDNHQESENLDEITAVYNTMRQRLLLEMKADAHRYWREYENWMQAGVFTKEELVTEGLLRNGKEIEYNELPKLAQYTAYANYEALSGCTDVYFFGIPGAGRLCLLMGIIGADGYGYSINFAAKGGPEALALRRYLCAGALPNSTPGKYVTTYNASIVEKRDKEGGFVDHHVNFVRMSGEEFAEKIANNDETVSLNDMGDGAKNLLRNSNRKVFFIVIDPIYDVIKYYYHKAVYDNIGNLMGVEPVTAYIDQEESFNKFVSMFELEENKEFMKQVDAIHFIVTKADTLGDTQEERNRKAHKLLMEKYPGVVYKLVSFLRRNRRINCTTDYQPRIFTFSLGKFYLNGEYDYDSKDSLYLVYALRHMTQGTKESTGMRKLLGKASSVVQPRPGDYGMKISFDE